MDSQPPKRTTAQFRAQGGNALLLKAAYEDAFKKALDDFTEKAKMYRIDISPFHIKILANLAGGYAREAVANCAFELRAAFINEGVTKEEHDAPTGEVDVPKTISGTGDAIKR